MALVVPITTSRPGSHPRLPEPDPTMLAIAAATMHAQGRLFEPIPPLEMQSDGAK